MTVEERKKLVGRLRRIAGQVRSLEQQLDRDPDQTINQILAVSAAMQACLRFYAEKRLLTSDELSDSDRRLLSRLLGRVY